VVLPFNELPVVVELAACPPEAELPPAVAPAPLPGLCEKAAVVESSSADANVIVVSFIRAPFICWSETNERIYLIVPPQERFSSRKPSRLPCA
jgi:hypothetical protein